MDKDEIKVYLKCNPDFIETILEEIGCHHIKVKKKYVHAALPDGNNPGAIAISLNDYLSTRIYTRSEFDKYEFKDIYALLDFLCGYNLNESIKFICSSLGITQSSKPKKRQISSSYSLLKKLKKSVSKTIETYREIMIDERILNQYHRRCCGIFYDDGINEITQEKFGILFDLLGNRILIPIRNGVGELITLKGRTCDKDYKSKGIFKYMSYYNFQGEYYLYGEYENKKAIEESTEVFIGESEKFVLQLDSMGINNDLSISKKVISPHQLNKLLKLGKDIVLCFDKDVTLEEIFIECKKFKGLCNVYYLWDSEDLLKQKESPSDKGIEIFKKLVEGKILFKG